MPSFDTVCEANMVDVKHAVENTAKEICTRFDFKGTPAAVELRHLGRRLRVETKDLGDGLVHAHLVTSAPCTGQYRWTRQS